MWNRYDSFVDFWEVGHLVYLIWEDMVSLNQDWSWYWLIFKLGHAQKQLYLLGMLLHKYQVEYPGSRPISITSTRSIYLLDRQISAWALPWLTTHTSIRSTDVSSSSGVINLKLVPFRPRCFCAMCWKTASNRPFGPLDHMRSISFKSEMRWSRYNLSIGYK